MRIITEFEKKAMKNDLSCLVRKEKDSTGKQLIGKEKRAML